MSARLLRDIQRREVVAANEVSRRAHLAVSRNQTLPTKARYAAQLALSNPKVFPSNARPVSVKDRCLETGKGRGVLSKQGLSRFQFKLQARKGALNGWSKASW